MKPHEGKVWPARPVFQIDVEKLHVRITGRVRLPANSNDHTLSRWIHEDCGSHAPSDSQLHSARSPCTGGKRSISHPLYHRCHFQSLSKPAYKCVRMYFGSNYRSNHTHLLNILPHQREPQMYGERKILADPARLSKLRYGTCLFDESLR